mgnify:CR=1 FL=1
MKNKIFFAIFMTVWIVIIVVNFIWPKQTFSQEENRMLATIPRFSFESFVNGDYLNGVNDYINDHFAFRNIYLKLNSWWEVSVMGKKENNGVYIGKDGYLFEKFEYGEEEKEKVKNNASAISNFAETMQEIDIPTYFVLVPNSIYINSDKLPENVEVPNQEDIINTVYSNIKNTKNINVTSALKEENKTKPLYFRTDHHMNSDGAYVVYREFCNTVNIQPVQIENFNKITVTNDFLGTFDSKAQLVNQTPDEIFVYENEINTNIEEAIYDKETTKSIFNEEFLTGKDKYSYFLNGNNSKAIIKTKVDNNKKLLVIKDSYAHIMSQFLCENYSEVHFLDPRYTNFDYKEYVQENGITDVLFLYNVSNFTTDTNLKLLFTAY